jgi:hypothetical protein
MTSVLAVHEVQDVELCQAIGDPLWSDECRFQVAERQAASDMDRGVETCHTTRFARECSFHLIRERARRSPDPGDASRAVLGLEGIRRAPDASALFWQEWLKDSRVHGVALGPERCEAVDAAARSDCRVALDKVISKLAADLPLEVICQDADQGVLLRFDDGRPAVVAPPGVLPSLQQRCAARP